MADTIKIAIAGPKTGSTTRAGADLHHGARQAIRDINVRGGVNGKMLEVKEYDDAGEPKQAVAVANKIVNDDIKFVVGHMASATAQPASDIYEDEGILMITPAVTSPEFTDRGYKLVFRTVDVDSTRDPDAGNFFAQDPENKAIVDALKADGKDPSGPYVFPAYAAVEVIAQAIEAAGTEDTDRVAEALRSGKFKTAIGNLSFDEKGNLAA